MLLLGDVVIVVNVIVIVISLGWKQSQLLVFWLKTLVEFDKKHCSLEVTHDIVLVFKQSFLFNFIFSKGLMELMDIKIL